MEDQVYCGKCRQECGITKITEVEKDHFGAFTTAEYLSSCCLAPFYTDPELTSQVDSPEARELYFMLYD